VSRARRYFARPALVFGITLAVAAPARAAFIVYACGGNLCQVNPDGTGQSQLTDDAKPGTNQVYGSPSLSRDGKLLAFTYAGHVLITGSDGGLPHVTLPSTSSALVVIMRPDGKSVLEGESTIGNGPGVEVCTYTVTGSGRNCPYGVASAGWAPDDNLLVSQTLGGGSYNKVICHVPVSANQACSDVRAALASHDLYDPAVSPDGSTLAVVVTPAINTTVNGRIALFDYRTGAFERDLTTGSDDELPTWSPDGSQIVFQRGGSLYLIAADGKPGSERRLVAGGQPTWGGTGAVTTTPTPSASGKLAVTIAASARGVLQGNALFVVVEATVTCTAGVAGEVELSTGQVFKAKEVLKTLQSGKPATVVLALPAGAVTAIRKALAKQERAGAAVVVVAQAGKQTKKAGATFVIGS